MKVTIGIPTYNQPAFIEKAVSSALAQNWPKLEVIVSDDHSEKDIRTLLQKFNGDPRFVFHQNERRLGRTGNYKKLLYELATGDWYVNLDGDDLFTDPDLISKAMNLVKDNGQLVAVIANCEVKDEPSESRIIYSTGYTDKQVVTGTTFLQDIADQKAQTTHLSTVFKRSIATGIDFYRLDILSSDFESIYRLALHGDIACLDTVAGIWNRHASSTVVTKSVKDSISNFALAASVEDHAKKMNIQLPGWEKKMLQNMIAAALVEAKKESRLFRTCTACLLNYPLATLSTLTRFRKTIKHLSAR